MKKTILIFFVLLLLIPTFVFASNTKTVYLTANGSKYHLYSCDYIKDIYYKTTVDNAEAQGYEPCKVCNPYGLANTNYKNMSNSSSNDESILHSNFIYIIAILLLFWIICYCVNIYLIQQFEDVLTLSPIQKLLFRQDVDDVQSIIHTSLACKREILFNIFAFVFLVLLNIKFLTIIALIYFIITTVVDGFLRILEIIAGIADDIQNQYFNTELWMLTLAKTLCVTSSVFIIFYLFKLV